MSRIPSKAVSTMKTKTKTATEIAEGLKLIPEKKESLRKALEDIQSCSSLLSSFTLKWKDIEDHFAAIELDICQRLKALQSKESAAAPSRSTTAAPSAIGSICASMDANGLREFIVRDRKSLDLVKDELTAALTSAPDPATLLLDAIIGPNPGEDGTSVGKSKAGAVLSFLQVVDPQPTPAAKEQAKELADLWWSSTNPGSVYALLRLISVYKIVDKFKMEDILHRITYISRRKHTIDICKRMGLHDHIPDLVEKLISKGNQIDAVKFIFAFDLLKKYSPIDLLKAYMKESRKATEKMQKEGKKNEAKVTELGAMKLVLSSIEEYKLDTEWKEKLKSNVAQLEGSGKKRTATVAASAKPQNQKQEQPQQLKKRPRVADRNPAPPVVLQAQPHLALTSHPTYAGRTGSYDLAAPSLFPSYGDPAHSGSASGPSLLSSYGQALSGSTLGRTGSLSSSYLYPPDHHVSSGLYDRPVLSGGHSLPGLPSSYNSPLYYR